MSTFWPNVAATALTLCTWVSAAHAQQQAQADSSEDLLFLASAQYGRPIRSSVGLAVFVPTGERRHPIRDGFLVEGSVGQGGTRVSAGPAAFLEYIGLDVRAVLSRTGASPRGATPGSTYGGLEGGITIAYVRVSAGVARRVAGASGRNATIFVWGAGLQFPFVW